MNPRVSIAVATYNGERFIDEQLESFLAQNRPPDEIVISDDGSKDGTLAAVEQFAERAGGIDVVVERNEAPLGCAANFSKAASRCTGDAIFFSDQDDRWYPEKIESVLKRLGSGAHVVTNDCVITDAEGTPWGTKLSNVRALGLPDDTFRSGCCTAFTREYAELVLPVPEVAEYDVWVSFMADKLRIRTILAEPLQMYRRHGSNTSNAFISWRNPTWWSILRHYGFGDPRSEWERRCAFLTACTRRLVERRNVAEKLAGKDAVERALRELADEQEVYSRRIAIVSKPKFARPREVVRMWRSGAYEHFGRWKSAAKDLVRP